MLWYSASSPNNDDQLTQISSFAATAIGGHGLYEIAQCGLRDMALPTCEATLHTNCKIGAKWCLQKNISDLKQ